MIATYLIGLLPVNYIMTTITSNVNPANIDQVISVVKDRGVVNALTAGVATPAFNTVKYVGGQLFNTVGGMINSTNWKERGEAWLKDAKSVFEQDGENTKQVSVDYANDWSFEKFPDYYQIVSETTNFDGMEIPQLGEIIYSDFDELGRTQTAIGNITSEMVAERKGQRESWESNSNPSGWPSTVGLKNQEVTIEWKNGSVYHGYFYNRSHLIANQLGGEASRRNAITGTRTQNVGGVNQKGGMRYPEQKAVDYLSQGNRSMLYSVQPAYVDNELIPRYVIVQMQSNDGSINETVVVYNTANGWTIDYLTSHYYQN